MLLQNPTEALGLFDPVLNAVASDHCVKISILVQVIAEEGKVDGGPVGGKVIQRETSPLSRSTRRMPFMISVEMALCLETRHATELCSNVTSAVT